MAAEFEDAYGDQNVDIDVTVRSGNQGEKPYLSVILTKVKTADDFVDAFTDNRFEIEAFFTAVRTAEAEYRRLTS